MHETGVSTAGRDGGLTRVGRGLVEQAQSTPSAQPYACYYCYYTCPWPVT